MRLKILGCGNAFSTKQYNQCFLLEEDGRRMLFDCGFQIPAAFNYHGIDIKTIDDIYISHAHADHCGGLEWMAFSRYDWVNRPKKYDANKFSPRYAPRLIANKTLLSNLWYKTLMGGLESMEGFQSTIETFFEPLSIGENESFIWQGWECSLIQQIHIMTGSMIASTFGLFMKKFGKPSLYFTADSQHCSPKQMELFYKDADMIFQDTELIGVDTLTKEVRFSSGVHASYGQLASWEKVNAIKLPVAVRNKMWLSHYQDFALENKNFFGQNCDWDALAKEDGFSGFLKLGQEFEI
jgi:ribonuclease BN (tRNA processing enzyme)